MPSLLAVNSWVVPLILTTNALHLNWGKRGLLLPIQHADSDASLTWLWAPGAETGCPLLLTPQC